MQTQLSNQLAAKKRKQFLVAGILTVAVVGAMALDTKVIVNGSIEDLRQQSFSPDNYAKINYPDIKQYVESNAVDATVLLNALREDKKAAGQKYGVGGGIGPVIPVSLEGTVTEGRSGIFKLNISGFPSDQTVRVQTGPALNGTDLRDATGEIKFGEFKNQIEYQDVGSAMNRVMKAEILDDLDRDNLVNKSVEITGVFRLINAKNWLITPVRMDVK